MVNYMSALSMLHRATAREKISNGIQSTVSLCTELLSCLALSYLGC